MNQNHKKMKKTGLLTKIIASSLILIAFFSCDKNDNNNNDSYSNGFFIINEGNFQHDNGSLSFFDSDIDSLINDVFYNANNRTIGDVFQSASIIDGKMFCAVNNSNKVEVADANTLKEMGVISGITYPRYIADAGDGKAYVSTWNNEVVEINTNEHSVTSTVTVGGGAEDLLVADGKLFIACTGGKNLDSSVYVINTNDNSLHSIIHIDYHPIALEIDANGSIWVLCGGKASFEATEPSPASIAKINSTYDGVELKKALDISTHPARMQISNDGKSLYIGAGYGHKGIQKISTETGEIEENIIDKILYGFAINPKDGSIIACIAPTYDAAGYITKYSPSGDSLISYTVGISPNGIIFK